MPSRTLILAAVFVALAMPAADAAAEADCDKLAADPADPQKVGPGVVWDAIDGAAAEIACRAALASSADIARMSYQLGRALDRQGKYDAAKTAYLDAFGAGYAIAARAFGLLAQDGLGGDIDYVTAADYFQRALDRGFTPAAGDLAYLVQEGLGVPKDGPEAVRLYRVAIEAGDVASAVNLGLMYSEGNGVPEDPAEAVRLYKLAVDKGDAVGQFNLGVMYLDGTGVPVDFAEAIRLFRLADAQDYAFATREVAHAFEFGIGVPKDLAEAERLYRKAIASDENAVVADAKNELAWLFALSGRNLDEAVTLVDEALAAMTDDLGRSGALETQAWIQHVRGNDAAARRAMQLSIDLDPEWAPTHDRMGDILAALGLMEEARAEWQKALALPLPDPYIVPDWDPAAVRKKL